MARFCSFRLCVLVLVLIEPTEPNLVTTRSSGTATLAEGESENSIILHSLRRIEQKIDKLTSMVESLQQLLAGISESANLSTTVTLADTRDTTLSSHMILSAATSSASPIQQLPHKSSTVRPAPASQLIYKREAVDCTSGTMTLIELIHKGAALTRDVFYFADSNKCIYKRRLKRTSCHQLGEVDAVFVCR